MAAQRQHGRLQRRILLLVVSLFLRSGEAYVTSGLPGHKHRAWLKQMTRDIVDAAPGELTAENLAAAPQLMAVWAENPYVPSTSSSRWTPPTTEFSPQHPSSDGPCSPFPNADHGLECALEVEALLKRLVDERVLAGNEDVAVTTEEYNAVLFGWANSGKGVSAAERAEQILIQMQEMYEAGDTDVRPDVQSFRAVLLAWSNAAQNSSHDKKCRAAQRSERILEYMAHLNNTLLDADCFDVVLRLWSSSGLPEAPLRAERLLAVMDQMYLDGNEACRLRASSFDEVLTAWCRRNCAATAKKNGKNGSATVDDPLVAQAPRRAEAILTHMEQLSDDGTFLDVSPNLASYTSVASAWGRAGGQRGAQMATKVLSRLERRYFNSPRDRDGIHELRPDTAMYNICIDAWAKAQTKDSYRQARLILDRQIAVHEGGVRRCRPDVYSYTLVLHACAAFSGTLKEKKRAFNAAWVTFEEMLESGKGVSPNHVTFGIMMKACARLLPKGSDKRERFARSVFERARREGCVGNMVTSRLREAVRPELYKELMGGASEKKLPWEWIRNVPDADRRQQAKSASSKVE